MPRVSAVIPAFNAGPFLAEAIRSVLDQSVDDVEVVVIDDGSTDNTVEIASNFGTRVVCRSQPNSGMAATRNAAIAAATGDWIGFLDADDTWLPTKVEKQLAALAARPGYKVCYSGWLVVDAALKPLFEQGIPPQGRAIEDLLFHGNIVGSVCTGLVEAGLLREVGGFDASLSHCADWDLWIRLAQHTEFAYVPEALVTYRQHGANLSRYVRNLENDSRRVLEKAFTSPATPPALRARRSAAIARNWMVLAGAYFQAGEWGRSLRCALRSLAINPANASRLFMFPWRRLSGRSDWRRQFQ